MIFNIFKKELKETLRDRRTIMTMIVIPILLFPIILNVFSGISSKFQNDAANKEVFIGIIADKDGFISKELNLMPKESRNFKILFYKDTIDLIKDLKSDSIQIGIYTNSDFEMTLKSQKPAPLIIYLNETDIGIQSRAKSYINHIETKARQQRLSELKIEQSKVTPLMAIYKNIATEKEMIGKIAGGILPYIFIAFGFAGCMYPAIDLFTGEKERGTIETILTTPVLRWQILFGKMGVVILSGFIAATFALLGLFLSFEFLDISKNKEMHEIILSILSVRFIISLFILLFPLIVFFAGIMTPIAVYAKSFKEAQSIITPLNILVFLPAMVGFFPGIELNLTTACIPVVNVVLATKDLIAGTLDIGLFSISFGVMFLIAFASVLFSYKQYGKESNIFS